LEGHDSDDHESTYKKLQELGITREDLETLLEVLGSLGKHPSDLRRYLRAAVRLRAVERETGRSFLTITREFDKRVKESVKLEYAINELKEKKRRMEEDLHLYLQQHNLTLDTVNRVSNLLSMLEKAGISTLEMEKLVSAAQQLKQLGGDPSSLITLSHVKRQAEQDIAALTSKIRELESELERLESEKREKAEELGLLLQVEPQVHTIIQTKKRYEAELEDLRKRREEMERKTEELLHQYNTLYNFRGSIDEVQQEIENRKKTLTSLDEEINRKMDQVKVLEEEVDAARSLLSLMTRPETAQSEELETIAHQLLNAAKVRAGEMPILKPLDQTLTENARRRVVELILPAIRRELVPRWVFEKLEKEFKSLVEKRTALEAEVDSLKRLLLEATEKKVAEPEAPSEPAMPAEAEETVRFFRLSQTGAELSKASQIKARLKCPYCGSGNLVMLPLREDTEAAAASGDKLVANCGSCTREIILDPKVLYRYY